MLRPLFILFLLLAMRCLAQAGTGDTTTFVAYPNPFIGTCSIDVHVYAKDTTSIDVFNLLGQAVKSFVKDSLLDSGVYHFWFDAQALPQGVYFLSVSSKRYGARAQKLFKSAPEPDSLRLSATPNVFTDFCVVQLELLKDNFVSLFVQKTDGDTVAWFLSHANLSKGFYSFPLIGDSIDYGSFVVTAKTDSLTHTVQVLRVACISDKSSRPSPVQPAFNMYPNPSHGKILIDPNVQSPAGAHISISNALAQLVLQQTQPQNQHEVDVSTLAPGVYFVRCIINNRSSTQKLLVE